MSICLLYQRVFSITRLRWAGWGLVGVSTAWFVTIQVGQLCACNPIQAFWVRPLPGQPSTAHCFNFNTFFFVEAVIDIIIDCAILILPLRAIHGLVITARTKVLLYSIFLLGGL